LQPVQIFRSYLKTPFIILLVVETCVMFGSVYCASLIRFYAGGLSLESALEGVGWSASVITLVTLLSMMSTGLYVGRLREGMAGILIRVALSMFMASMAVGLIFYLLPVLTLWRGVLAITYLLSFFVVGTLRTVFFELVDTQVFKTRVLIYGAGSDASYIDKKLRRKADRRGFEIHGYVLLENQQCQINRNHLVTIDTPLLEYVRDNQISEIVIATSDIDGETTINELVECKLNGVGVLDILSFFEREAGQIRIDIIDPIWLVTSPGFGQARLQKWIKRSFDLAVSFCLMLVTIPVQLLIVIAIWSEEGFGAPVIYRQQRAGEHGKCFNVYKFRSMIIDAENGGKAVWASDGDSRVTRTGNILRKYRLDELPQVINVIRGDMSFVGPRPERPEIIAELEKTIPYYAERHVLKPGLTGWAQLNYPYGASEHDAFQKQLYDMYYVKNHSIFLDCLILLQTVEVVLFGKGGR
jgi:sugar transferase (PEP-CTERM system associated)